MWQKNRGGTRIFKAAYYSYKGIHAALKNEAAFRTEVIFALFLIPLAFWLDVSPVERIVMIASVVLVLVVELLNSAIEAVVDRIGTEMHDLAGRAKDMGSAAVSVCLLLWAYIWAAILLF